MYAGAGHFRRVVALGLILLVAGLSSPVGGVTGVLAQAPTEAAEPGPNDPAACTVAPRPVEDLVAIMAEGMTTPRATDIEHLTGQNPPSGGVAADAAVVSAVTETLEEFAACANSGDFLRISALWTDDLLRQVYGGLAGMGSGQSLTAEAIEEQLAVAATPTPDQWQALQSVSDVKVLSDGRIVALARIGDTATHCVLKKSGDHYLIDGIFPLESGTPSP